ncbi:FKBP-type peptidyl-prolyl cis-trans isomerase [Mycobacterium sp. CPCC 205372]|uniref:Peptidyl-prolyl cis-trans isomerase n=1 Tax=Mycobacterium hippophais TaxID=3016340 RepID=A0ABT4PVQ8_9MYCO|nr:FKBP-type peptidyl-prolyl cis-trans isomerase [Mycobacterium hippophais]MCZ8380656.1 FKBP-type peptidyl-prolyl cis-trans isomerase [Mycobacterium hippophais]
MNSPRLSSSVALAACAASLVIGLTACGSDTSTASTSSSSSRTPVEFFPPSPAAPATPEAPAAAAACPSTPPAQGAAPEWTLPGATGSVAVTGSTDAAAPLITVTAPFSVGETQVQTLQAGDGPVVADTASVSVCYMGVNGRDGSVFDSSYVGGPPVEFSLDGVVAGFQKAIAGQKVGSTVGVAMTSADGYPDGQPSAGIEKGDTLVFAIKILDASS